jgi:integrase
VDGIVCFLLLRLVRFWWKDCPACAGAKMTQNGMLDSNLLFPEAFEVWLSHRLIEKPGFTTDVCYITQTTVSGLKNEAKSLSYFFKDLRLKEIHLGHLREYQQGRAFCDKSMADWKKPAGPAIIRKEMMLMIRILKAAACWTEDQAASFGMVAPLERDVQRAMSPDEQALFLRTANSRVEWQHIYWYAIVALQTTASTNELRGLRLGDIMLDQGVLQIRRESSKNKYRIRTIPLETREVFWALSQLVARAKGRGSTLPIHYLFPKRHGKRRYDPNQHMTGTGITVPWCEVRAAAGLPWLRMYDLRHTAITRMAEAGTPIQVIMSYAGHMTLRMQQHYTTISLMAKRKWAQMTWGEDTQHAQYGQPKAPASATPILPYARNISA